MLNHSTYAILSSLGTPLKTQPTGEKRVDWTKVIPPVFLASITGAFLMWGIMSSNQANIEHNRTSIESLTVSQAQAVNEISHTLKKMGTLLTRHDVKINTLEKNETKEVQ